TVFPQEVAGEKWALGADVAYLRKLVEYWHREFDWRAQERNLNQFPQFRTQIEGLQVHFVHVRAVGGSGLPLLLTHGWPSSFAELLPIVPLLTDPAAHGIDGPAFDVVIPSLPGYAFSERTATPWTLRDTARLWRKLMATLGYEQYGLHGGDFGAAVSTFIALDTPSVVKGLHLSNLELAPYLGDGAAPLSAAEQAFVQQEEQWVEAEGGYYALFSTKPQTWAVALSDSPVGLAALILEKWRTWSDSGGDLERRFSRDFLLTTIMLYWFTNCIGTSVRDYFDNRTLVEQIGPDHRVHVPTAIGLFGNEFVDDGDPPRAWAERLYNVTRWQVMPRGGHFAATEEPMLLAQDIAAFFKSLTV
ncbi:MAG: epoxide hydrolase family protein, partial [Myxococcota bacterium]